jgi:hypothetical protein
MEILEHLAQAISQTVRTCDDCPSSVRNTR